MTGLHLRHVAQADERGHAGNRCCRRLLEAQSIGRGAELIFTGAGELRVRARRCTEHRVTDSESRHLDSDGLDHATHVHAKHVLLRLGQTRGEAHREGLARHQMPLAALEAGGLHSNQHFVLLRHRTREPRDL
jgi:hypothetical protein